MIWTFNVVDQLNVKIQIIGDHSIIIVYQSELVTVFLNLSILTWLGLASASFCTEALFDVLKFSTFFKMDFRNPSSWTPIWKFTKYTIIYHRNKRQFKSYTRKKPAIHWTCLRSSSVICSKVSMVIRCLANTGR